MEGDDTARAQTAFARGTRAFPFSYPGAWMAVSRVSGTLFKPVDRLMLRSLRAGVYRSDLFDIALVDAGGTVSAPDGDRLSPGLLTARHGDDAAAVRIAFESPCRLRMRAEGAGLRLTRLPGGIEFAGPAADGAWRALVSSSGRKYRLMPVRGTLRSELAMAGAYLSSWVLEVRTDDSGAAELAIDEYAGEWQGSPPARAFDEVAAAAAAAFREFESAQLPAAEEHREVRRQAAYTLWAGLASPSAPLARRGVLMSKNWMNSVWSWDHCFNAVALARADGDLAWDQLSIPFDAQDEQGGLPDLLSDRYSNRAYVKPPIHGWALRELMHAGVATPARLRDFLPRLGRWTEWWFRHRDEHGTGFPEYHHGNDSGWDNCSAFSGTLPCAGPDLGAYLVLQMDALADGWAALGETAAACRWRERADDFLDRYLDRFWDGRAFGVRNASGATPPAGSDSLLSFMPLALGNRLPGTIRGRLVPELMAEGRFLTPWGLATEALTSPHYLPDGYWLGPVWASPMVLLVSGLVRMRLDGPARILAARFMNACAKGGMAENFDARDGAPLRDPAYSWTAAAALLFGALLGSGSGDHGPFFAGAEEPDKRASKYASGDSGAAASDQRRQDSSHSMDAPGARVW